MKPKRNIDIIPTPEIALDGTSPFSVAAATWDDMAATSERAAAKLNDPQTNLVADQSLEHFDTSFCILTWCDGESNH